MVFFVNTLPQSKRANKIFKKGVWLISDLVSSSFLMPECQFIVARWSWLKKNSCFFFVFPEPYRSPISITSILHPPTQFLLFNLFLQDIWLLHASQLFSCPVPIPNRQLPLIILHSAACWRKRLRGLTFVYRNVWLFFFGEWKGGSRRVNAYSPNCRR